MWYVYIIENVVGQLYIGCSSDLESRLKMHNGSRRPGWTRGRGPWKIIYKEPFQTKQEAMKRERYLKGLKAGLRVKKLLNIIDDPR